MEKQEAIAYGNDYYKDLISACCEIDEKHKEFVRMSLEALKQEPCEDAVSRKAVLEYIEHSCADLESNYENDQVYYAIKDMPSVTPIQKWIPVSEGLPKIGSTVLIQFVDSSNGISMDDYGSCELSWLRDGDRWVTGSGSFKESEILAWMPLPEAYKESD